MPRFLVFAVLLLSVGAGAAQAHVANLSTSTLTVAGQEVRATLMLNPADVAAALGRAAPPASDLLAYLDGRVGVSDSAGLACQRVDGRIEDGAHIEAALVWQCTGEPSSYRAAPFQELDPSARHIVLQPDSEGGRQAVLDANRTEIVFGVPQSAGAVVWAYLLSGIEHIFVGYDHIAFLLAVILWARSVRTVLAIVTGFTLAHSVTLSLAALDVVSLPSSVVEPLVAASIVVVAIENYLVPNASHRWWIAALFGLIHGFAFADVLGEVGLPQGAKLVALFAFNLGVEVGQIAIVLVVVPLFILADRTLSTVAARRLAHTLSSILLVFGVYWFVDRVI